MKRKEQNICLLTIVSILFCCLAGCKEHSKFHSGKYADISIRKNGTNFIPYNNENHSVQFIDSGGVQVMITKYDSVALTDTCYFSNGINYLVKHYTDYEADKPPIDYYLCTQICDSFLLRFIIRKNTQHKYGVYAVDSINFNSIVRRTVDYSSVFFAEDLISVIKHLNEIENRNFNNIKYYWNAWFYNDSVKVIEGILDYAYPDDEEHTFSFVPSYKKLSVAHSMYFLQFQTEFTTLLFWKQTGLNL